MNKKIIIPIILVVAIIAIVAFMNRKPNYTNTALEPIEKLVQVQYFKDGTHEEYQSLFTNPEGTLAKGIFEEFRKSSKPEDTFKYGAKDPKQVMKHMKFIEEKDNKELGKVYYLKDVEDTKELENLQYWMVEKVNDRWLIKNN